MSLDEDLYTVLTNLTGVPVEQNKVSLDKATTRIWFGYSGSNAELYLDGTPMMLDATFDVECQSLDLATAESLALNILMNLHGLRGTFGSSQVLGVFVSDHMDDYQPRGINNDDGFNVASVSIRILQDLGGS